MAYGLSDMMIGLATRTGYSIGDIFVVFLAGYLFLRSKFARSIGQDLIIMLATLLILVFSNTL